MDHAGPIAVVARRGRDRDAIRQSVLEHLVYEVGKDPDHAVPRDWCVALSLAVRDRIVDDWIPTTQAVYRHDRKRVYYLSMEFLVGRLLGEAIGHLGIEDACRAALTELGADYDAALTTEPDPALGNGGLGRLAACFLDSMASLGVAAYGYGIRYEHGLFKQGFDDGWQIEEADDWLTVGNPWEFERPEVTYPIGFGGTVAAGADGCADWQPTEHVLAAAYDTPVAGRAGGHVNTLRLWAAKPKAVFDLEAFNRGNFMAAAERQVLAETLSRVLYPDDTTPAGQELRLKQEYFFTAASLMDLLRRFRVTHDDLTALPRYAAIQLNDTHPAIAVPELMRLLIDEHGVNFDAAFAIARGCLSYTNHTLLPEALERWPLELFGRVLPRHLELIAEIDRRAAAEVEASGTGVALDDVRVVDQAHVRMGNLAFVGCHKVNGVSALHTDLMRETVFAGLNRVYPDRIVNQTNGITPRRWLADCNPGLASLLRETIGDAWELDLEQLEALEPFADDPRSARASPR